MVYLVQVENRECPVPNNERRWVPPLYASDRSVAYGLHHREPIVVVELMGFVWRVVVSTVIRQFIYWLFRSPSNRRR